MKSDKVTLLSEIQKLRAELQSLNDALAVWRGKWVCLIQARIDKESAIPNFEKKRLNKSKLKAIVEQIEAIKDEMRPRELEVEAKIAELESQEKEVEKKLLKVKARFDKSFGKPGLLR